MSAITSLPSRHATSGDGRVHAAVRVVSRWWVAYTAWRIQRLAIARLREMSDRQLKDIGIVRAQIEHAVRTDTGRCHRAGARRSARS